ncbi:hypothetical protein HKD37_15G043587 [Glycine soja]
MLPMMAFPMAATTFPPERDRPASSIQTCKWVSVSLCEVSVSGTLSSVSELMIPIFSYNKRSVRFGHRSNIDDFNFLKLHQEPQVGLWFIERERLSKLGKQWSLLSVETGIDVPNPLRLSAFIN